MSTPKNKATSNEDEEIETEEEIKERQARKYQTCRLNEERASKKTKDESGNKSTEDDDEWSY